MTSLNLKFPPEILALDQEIGEFMEYWGFKRIHGRVWLHLYLSDMPLDVAELMRRLGVSKALMSFCIRDLKEYSVIVEDGVAKHGTILYRANPDLFAVIKNVLRIRERPLLSRIRAAQQLAITLPEKEMIEHQLNPKKVRELGKLVVGADRALRALSQLSNEGQEEGGSLLQVIELIGGIETAEE